ncbi:hypothetical protein [Streptomyces monashensis]|uniref:hypothetical protein n=1 Tax=Streptomyces monashensis TaxID=1678012 RepID=UPI000A617E28
MRGLTRAGSDRAPGGTQAVITVGAVLAALTLLVAACGTGGTGARDEGPAHASAVAGAVASPSASPSGTYKRVDAVTLVKDDPAVSTTVKSELKPCSGEEYPVDVTYGQLTGGSVDDVIVNVLTCADAVGIGSYVYRDEGGTYKNVFKTEESPVYAEVDQGLLTVTKQVYKKGDPISSPSGEDVITYDWTGGRFAGRPPVHTDYGKTGAGSESTPPPDG